MVLHHSAADDSEEKYPWGASLSATLLCPAKIPEQNQSEAIEPSFGVYFTPTSESCFHLSGCNPTSCLGFKLIWSFTLFLWEAQTPVPLCCSAAAAAAAAASRCALSSLAASWAPRAPDRARRPDPPPSARPGWGSPDGCGPIGKPWACWERCWAWSCCCREEDKRKTKKRDRRKRDLGDLRAPKLGR